MPQAAVIFDVDGPLLELTPQEENLFFVPLTNRFGLENLSRDWDSYRIRNDIEIYREILTTHVRPEEIEATLDNVATDYVTRLKTGYETGALEVVSIPGACQLLQRLHAVDGLTLGIATANLGAAAKVRLLQAGMWRYVEQHPGAAEAGGHKSNILASVLAGLGVAPSQTVFLGDNLNDLEAGRENGVHFIGFHTDATRRKRLTDAGAETVCGDHKTTWDLIRKALDLA